MRVKRKISNFQGEGNKWKRCICIFYFSFVEAARIYPIKTISFSFCQTENINTLYFEQEWATKLRSPIVKRRVRYYKLLKYVSQSTLHAVLAHKIKLVALPLKIYSKLLSKNKQTKMAQDLGSSVVAVYNLHSTSIQTPSKISTQLG